MRVVVLHSGGDDPTRPDEAETIETCEDIEASLRALGHEPARMQFLDNLGETERALRADKPDMVFNMVEAAAGTDRLSYIGPAMLEYLGIPYTGCPAAAIAMAASKLKMKNIMEAAGVPTPAYFNGVGSGTGGPWIVKSATEHASVGVDAAHVVPTAEEARRVMEGLKARGGHWFAEKFVEGREYNVYLLSDETGYGLDILGVSEIVFNNHPEGKPKVYDYAAKWHYDSPDFEAVTRSFDVPPLLNAELQKHARKVWEALGLRGAARIDFRVDDHGHPYVIDVNLNPCMSTGCAFADAANRVELSFDGLIRRLVLSASEC